MPSCAFSKCNSSSKIHHKASGITFHAFPKDLAIRDKWVKNVRESRRDENWTANEYSRVCSNHFAPSDIYTTKKGMRKINKTATPYCRIQERELESVSPSTPKNLSPTAPTSTHATPSSSVSVPSSIFDTPRKALLRNQVRKLNYESKKQKLKLRSLQQKNSRLQKKCISLKSIVKNLEQKQIIPVDFTRELELKAESAELINRIYLNRKGRSGKRKYPPALRKFALTLHFYSASAYLYVRRMFSTALPHPRTLRKWYENNKAEPGFTAQAFEALKNKSEATGKRIICTLVADEMAIRQQTQWNGKKTLSTFKTFKCNYSLYVCVIITVLIITMLSIIKNKLK